MKQENNIWDNKKLIETLANDGVVIVPTDTLYGMLGKALSESVVSRIYTIRNRDTQKPCIILIGDIKELEKFSIELSSEQKKVLEKYWPGPVSIILDCDDNKLEYLYRGTKTLAFRLPGNRDLQNFLKKTGPLIAPSANTEGLPSAQNISEAQKYFGNAVDLYVDGGTLTGKASRLIKLHKNGSETILRE